ncbi:hypothetical protein PF003_g11006 [Phytophthora fragariae]|nr:hypothetical protein PF003_g11007 [Phytophthora fragariae]KAE8904880.1 hypothetical protein PF003_g11006 [Phytophthora fragariae]
MAAPILEATYWCSTCGPSAMRAWPDSRPSFLAVVGDGCVDGSMLAAGSALSRKMGND